jgi:hypothetical protein
LLSVHLVVLGKEGCRCLVLRARGVHALTFRYSQAGCGAGGGGGAAELPEDLRKGGGACPILLQQVAHSRAQKAVGLKLQAEKQICTTLDE